MGARQDRMGLRMAGSAYMNRQPLNAWASKHAASLSICPNGAHHQLASFVILKSLRGTESDGRAENAIPRSLWRTGGQRVGFCQAMNGGEENVWTRAE